MSAAGALVAHYSASYPDEVARHVERLGAEDAVVLASSLSPETAAALLPHLAPAHAARLLEAVPIEVAGVVAERLQPDVAAALFRRMDPEVVSRLLAALPADLARGIGALLSHAPATAGGVMDPHVLTVPSAVTVAEARALLEAAPAHLYYYVYVLDAGHRLAGVFDLAELMQANPGAPVRAIMTPQVTWLAADAPLESIFAHPGWRTFDAMPVVDRERRFLGVVRHRRVRELQEQTSAAGGDDHAVRTMIALGEIYWLGLCGLLQGIASTAAETPARGEAS